MNDEQGERFTGLLDEIRDGQRLQLERQAQALRRQEELIAQQRIVDSCCALNSRSSLVRRFADTRAI
jgi:hypothetical protein